MNFRKHRYFFIIAALFILIILLFQLCHKKNSSSADTFKNAVPVVVAIAHTADVPVYFTALGNVQPLNSVLVKTQINGQLKKVFFQEGQNVKAGDVIFQIDDALYQAQLLQYEGQLIKDKALLANAKVDLARDKKLYPLAAISQQTLATQEALVKQYIGQVKSDQGQVETARVNIDYCRMTAPVTGRIGLRKVDAGNFVQTSDANGLAVINTLDPIAVTFTIPEDNLDKVEQQFESGQKFDAQAYNRDQSQLIATGQLIAIDNQIDPTTGTVKLKAQFSNKNNALFANQFVNVKLQVSTLQKATVVPTAAIQYGTTGAFVYLLNTKQNTVSLKKVVTGPVDVDNTVITSGIDPGQSVVVEGVDKVTDGSIVTLYKN